MNEGLLQRFVQLIATQTGLQVRPQDRNLLNQKLWIRIRQLGLSAPEDYYHVLENPFSYAGALEWKALMLLLTIGESYFFRDQGQFHLLRTVIVPELIAQKRASTPLGRPTLRLWSAGCSTGEEPYSLAILLHELIPDRDAWNLSVVGTDINHESIERARRGIYNAWSFRSVDASIQSRYFQPRHLDWELRPEIRQMVSFGTGNLVQDPYPNSFTDLAGVDLILCRNVFIYFNGEAIATVLRKFYQTLRPGGYLLTGHTELQGLSLNDFQTKLFSTSVVYHRPAIVPTLPVTVPSPEQSVGMTVTGMPPLPSPPVVTAPALPVSPPPPPPPPQEKSEQQLLQQAQAQLQAGNYPGAIRLAQDLLKQHPNQFDACELIAQAYGNLGDHDQARHYCRRALDLNAFAVSPYYLLAQLAEAEGDTTTAKLHFKKIIYLMPTAAPAYVELSALYDQEGDHARAQKLRATALELLQKLPPDTLLPLCHATVSEVIHHLQDQLPDPSTSPS